MMATGDPANTTTTTAGAPPARRRWLKSLGPEQVRSRFMLTVLVCLLLISLPAVLLFHHYQLRTTDAMIRDQGHGVLENYITQTRDSIEKGQRKSFALVMDNIAQLEGVIETTVYDRDGLMNYRSGTVTVGIPFVHDEQGNFVNPNAKLYQQTAGMYLREDWHLVDRIDSPRGLAHRQQVAGRPCADCHFMLNETLQFDHRGRVEATAGDTARFYEKVPVESRCMVCHTHWRVGELAGVLAVSMDKSSFLAQAHENTRRLIYFLLINGAVVLAVTFLVATMYRHILLTRRELAAKSGRLAGLLDNSGQGFLSFGPDLRVEAESSRECRTMLDTEPAGRNIAELFQPDNPAEAKRLAANLQRIFTTEDDFKRDTLLTLLPGRFAFNGRQLEIAYRLINPKLIMLIITDITEKLRLEAQVAEEQTRLRLIVTAATESAELFEVLDDYRKFGRQDLPRLLAAADEPALAEIYRQVHTFKGLFGQMEFIYLPDALHEFESELRQYKESATARPNPDELVGRLQQADAALERDLAILRDTLGESFFARRGRLELDPEDVAMLEQLADRLLHAKGPALDSADTRALLQRLKQLRYVPFGHLLAGYAKAAGRLAQRQEKELAPVGIEDHGLRVPPEVYAPFAKSLVHLFRNAVDHGIETPEERWESDKEEEGHINCRAWAEGDGIVLEIADDGRGLDVEAIRGKAVEKGLLAAEAPGLEPEELYRLIFTDEFSTKQTADAMSGRGVGLAAVRMETQRLGGEIEVESTPGAGTIFRFRLPLPGKNTTKHHHGGER